MKALLNAVKWLVIPIATTLIAVGVWFAMEEGEGTDDLVLWAVSGLVIGVLIVLVIFLVFFLRDRNKAGKLESGLGAGGGMDQRGEVEALRKAWKESLSTLKASGVGGGGKRALQALPWFVIIGAPASGKSTLLRQSGIDFPVGDAALRGLQGTRNCDWWFSNVGIFLDTAGRYISDQSAQEWARFLELVRKQRSGAPINGCIVAIPASDLIARTPEQVELDARRIRARLDELIDHLGISFPVWVVVTKVDLIGGFAEFFRGLDATGRAQMMGWTADLAEGGSFDRTRFRARFDAVVHRLREMRPQLVHGTKLLDRPMAFSFPDQLGELGEPLSRMMHRIFEPNVYQETPFFRGLYVTSATQEGTPLQKAAARIRQLLGAAPSAPDTSQGLIKHCFFVKDLMHERIVQDRHMTWTTKKEVERGKLKRLGMNLTGASFGVLLALIVLGYGMRARKELDRVGRNMETAQTSTGGVERCNGLWMAAFPIENNNRDNLGLSRQKTLKRKLEREQASVFRSKVLLPLVGGFETDLSRTDVPLEQHVATYDAYLEVRTLLERTAEGPDAEQPNKWEKASEEDAPDGKEPDESESGDGIEDEDRESDDGSEADALPGGPPAHFYGPSARERLLERHARLKNDRVIDSESGATRFLDPLLTCLWRNRAEVKDLDESHAAVEAAFKSRIQEFVTSSAAVIREFNESGKKRLDLLHLRRDRFVQASTKWHGRLYSKVLEDGDFGRALAALIAAAKGQADSSEPLDPGATEPPTKTDEHASLDLLASIPDQMKPLEGLLPREELDKIPGYSDVADFDPTESGVERAPGKVTDEERLHGALAQITKSLEELQRSSGNIARTWDINEEAISDVLKQIDTQNTSFASSWQGRLLPHLEVVAASHDGWNEGDPPPVWTRTGLGLPAALHRDAYLRAYLTAGELSEFDRRARRLARDLKSKNEFTATSISSYFDKVMEVVAYACRTFEGVLVSPGVRNDATERASAAFQQLTVGTEDAPGLAQAHWDAQFDDIRRLRGSGRNYLDTWTDKGDTRDVMKGVEKEFGKTWDVPLMPESDEASQSGSRIWQFAETLHRRYSSFASSYDQFEQAIASIQSCVELDLEKPSDRSEIAAALDDGGGRPAWHIADSAWESGGQVEGLSKSLQDLQKAFEKVEEDLLKKIERHFNGRWAPIRESLIDAKKSGDATDLEDAQARLDNLTEDLRTVFGAGLSRHLLARMRVAGDYKTVSRSLESESDRTDRIAKGLDLTLTCKRVLGEGANNVARVEYREEGQEPQVQHWTSLDTGTSMTIRFHPGRGRVFAVYLLPSEKDPNTAGMLLVSKPGRNCLLDAIRDYPKVDSEDWVLFSKDGSKAEVQFAWGPRTDDLTFLLDGSTSTGGDREMPRECVILDPKK